MHIRGSSKFVTYLECSSFLAFDSIRIDTVDNFNVISFAQLSDYFQGVIEVAPDFNCLSSVNQCLGHFA